MATQPCDACGAEVSIAGGIANLWTLEHDPTGGMTLELADGSEFFLCFACIEALPDDTEITAADVERIGEARRDERDGEARRDERDGED